MGSPHPELLLQRQVIVACLAVVLTACATRQSSQPSEQQRRIAAARAAVPELARPNDNRTPAGTLRDGVLTISIDARLAPWRPDLDVDSTVTVQAFAEKGQTASIPGPLIRVPLGTEIRATLHNAIPDSTLIVHGLRPGTPVTDTVQIAPGATREISFRPIEAGTLLYWGTTSRAPIGRRWGREAQLNGAIVVDPPGAPPTPDDRILVLSLIDIYPDSLRNQAKEDIWEVAINGLSWPHTERLHHQVGDTIRWRLINATDRVHPMHLHGFHFRTLAKGNWTKDTTYKPDAVAHAVTEFMLPGSTARIEWTPTRGGNWLMHCHMTPHITPFPERADTIRAHDHRDLARHAEQAMAGLVLGIITTERSPSAVSQTPKYRERIFAQQSVADSPQKIARGFVIDRGADPRKDSVEVPGSPLILYRGERTAVTVVNRMPVATTVHWHGMELESVFDGVSGWSGFGKTRAPMVMPGDSFTVSFTPPRAGTYMYHTHMDEEDQLAAGMYAPMLVLEPGEKYDPANDLVFMLGSAVVNGKRGQALNGANKPKPLVLEAGKRYRFRLINIQIAAAIRFRLVKDTVPVVWRAVGKDGAILPAVRSIEMPAVVAMGVGETYDFDWTPPSAMEAKLEVRNFGPREPFAIDQAIIVRAATADKKVNGKAKRELQGQ